MHELEHVLRFALESKRSKIEKLCVEWTTRAITAQDKDLIRSYILYMDWLISEGYSIPDEYNKLYDSLNEKYKNGGKKNGRD
jgi:hypothetical protein